MAIDRAAVPHYIVLVDEYQKYVLNSRRQILGYPSDELARFAKRSAKPIAIDARAWNTFAKNASLGPIERKRRCCYIVIEGTESDDDLQWLIDM